MAGREPGHCPFAVSELLGADAPPAPHSVADRREAEDHQAPGRRFRDAGDIARGDRLGPGRTARPAAACATTAA